MRAFACAAITLVTMAALVPTAFGQAGSTGGTLGNSDKSISGERREEPAPPTKSQTHRSASAPAAAKSSGCGPILGKWLWFNGVTVVVNANQTTTQSDGHSASVACTDGVYTFNWGIGSATMTLSADRRRMTGRDSLGPASASRE
jgi:hypothetical protein